METVRGRVQSVVALRSELVDTIHIDRRHRMSLVHWQAARYSVDLSSAHIDHSRRRIAGAHPFESRQRRPHVVLEVFLRALHALDVARLSCEIKDDITVRNECAHEFAVPRVSLDYPHLGNHVGEMVSPPPASR